MDFDKVVVLDKGCVAEQGPPKELAEANGMFRKMLAAKRWASRREADFSAKCVDFGMRLAASRSSLVNVYRMCGSS